MISRFTRVLILNVCIAGVLLLTWARDGHYIILMCAIIFLGINVPTILLMRLIPQREGDKFPLKLRILVWPMLISGWMVAAAALLSLVKN